MSPPARCTTARCASSRACSRPRRPPIWPPGSARAAHLHALGITHWQDAIVGEAPDIGIPDAYATYRAAAPRLADRDVNGALWWDRTRGAGQIAICSAGVSTRRRGGSVPPRSNHDGRVCETRTAAMTEPYDGRPAGHSRGHGHRGSLFVPPEEVAEAVRLLSQEGFQVHFHALGDRAVHVALDALAAWAAPADLRHHLAHLQFIRPDDLDRFRDLDAVANSQPLWACHDPQMDDLTLPIVGPERAPWQYRIGTLARRGTRMAFGSDWPVSSADPLQEIHVAVNRRLSGRLGQPGTAETDRPFLPDEAIPVARALTAFTAGVAYVNHREAELGSLRPGHLADIAVLDRDILTIPPDDIGTTQVDLTLAGGQFVHGAQ